MFVSQIWKYYFILIFLLIFLKKSIAQYPSAEQPDALNITVNDLNCLDECEFLNDNIIYAINEINKIDIFIAFF